MVLTQNTAMRHRREVFNRSDRNFKAHRQRCRVIARQAKGGSHATEIPTPTPAVNLRFNIDGLTKGREMMMMMFITIFARDEDLN